MRALLDRQSGFTVVGEASNGMDALKLIEQQNPDIVVMDIRMPEMNGIDCVRRAMAINPQLRIVGLSADADDRLAVELLRAGAKGFVRKDAAYDELMAAIEAAINNHVYCNSAVIARMLREHQHAGEGLSAFELLSPRERQYLQLLAEGKSTKEIAALLDISVKTAETHRRNLLIKVNADSVADLVKYAMREGLTTL
jgi:DNA-binding NarL/FixJ family response regulator